MHKNNLNTFKRYLCYYLILIKSIVTRVIMLGYNAACNLQFKPCWGQMFLNYNKILLPYHHSCLFVHYCGFNIILRLL